MIRRPRRTLPAVIVALVLLALSVGAIVWAVQRLAGAREFVSYQRVATELHGRTWDDVPVLVTGVVLAALGLVLLVLAIWPGRAVVVPLAGDDGLRGGVTRRGLGTALRASATTVVGVSAARIRVRRKAVKARIRTDRARSEGLAEAVCERLTTRVQEIGPQSVRKVKASVHGGRRAKAEGRRGAKGQLGAEPAAPQPSAAPETVEVTGRGVS